MNRSTILSFAVVAFGAASDRHEAVVPELSTSLNSPAAGEKPFPLKTTTLKLDGATYYIEGRVRIPHNQTIVSLRHMTLVGRGSEAMLEVSGKLEIKAATGGRNHISNLTIVVMPDCKDLLVTETIFSDGGGVRSSPDGPSSAEIYLQNLQLRDSATISLKMGGGQVDLQDSSVSTPVRIKGIDPSEKNRAKLKVLVLNNKGSGGLSGGLLLDNAWDALVRNNDLSGAHSVIQNCRKLDFDGNNVRSQLFELLQKDVKRFKKTKVLNCDFRSPTVRIYAPLDPKKPKKLERMSLQGCWFNGSTDADEIREKYVKDSGREELNGMLITFRKTSPRMRGLGGTAGG